nr:hypothetical protein [Candidatus Njordarchaeota archaeon]
MSGSLYIAPEAPPIDKERQMESRRMWRRIGGGREEGWVWGGG